MSNLPSASKPLACVDQGRGQVLLLVHGFPLDHRIWESQIESLSQSHRVLAPDLQGFGQSTLSSQDMSMDAYARALDELLTVKGISEPVHMAGFSMGGYVALAFMRKYAKRIASLMLVDTKAAADTAEGAQGRASLADKVLVEGASAAAAAMTPKLFGKETVASDSALVARVKQIMLDQAPASIAAALHAMAARPDSTPSLASIHVPTLLIVGDQDAITPPAEMQKVADLISGSKLVTIEAAGHMTTMEQPAAVNEAIKQFLNQ